MQNHRIDMIRAYELAEKGVERVGLRSLNLPPKPLPLDDPTDYTQTCTPHGSCACYTTTTACYDPTECVNMDTQTCTCDCPAPSKAHSHAESNTCSSRLDYTCTCTMGTHKCATGKTCACGCNGICNYHCDPGWHWDVATSTCVADVAGGIILLKQVGVGL